VHAERDPLPDGGAARSRAIPPPDDARGADGRSARRRVPAPRQAHPAGRRHGRRPGLKGGRSMDLSTTYLGFDLPHPLMPGASPMADDLDTVRRLEDAGAAAIVLRSLFEEQIAYEEAATFA